MIARLPTVASILYAGLGCSSVAERVKGVIKVGFENMQEYQRV